MCQDDVIPNNLLQNYFKVYQENPEVMAITRNYYLYNKKIYKPFRIWKFTKKNDLLFSHSKDNKPENFLPFIKTLDNMTHYHLKGLILTLFMKNIFGHLMRILLFTLSTGVK